MPNPENRTDPALDTAVATYAIDEPTRGQVRASNELRYLYHSSRVFVASWLRNDFANLKQRLTGYPEVIRPNEEPEPRERGAEGGVF